MFKVGDRVIVNGIPPFFSEKDRATDRLGTITYYDRGNDWYKVHFDDTSPDDDHAYWYRAQLKLANPIVDPLLKDVNHPHHYTSHPAKVECIEITEHMNFCLGNAIKYIWRAGLKTDDPLKDLRKAKWYVEREIARLEKNQ